MLIFDAISLQTVNILQAHRTPLAQLSFNYDGTMLATASDKVMRGVVAAICGVCPTHSYDHHRVTRGDVLQ